MRRRCDCEDVPEDGIHKIGAVIVRDRKLLVVRTRGTDAYTILGGKHEAGESRNETLEREVAEEVQLGVAGAVFLGRHTDRAHRQDVPFVLDAYLVECAGEPKPGAEIEEFQWVGKDYDETGITLGSGITKFIIPELVKRGLL
jgi:8-oxo-dGTP diphosphatase